MRARRQHRDMRARRVIVRKLLKFAKLADDFTSSLGAWLFSAVILFYTSRFIDIDFNNIQAYGDYSIDILLTSGTVVS